MLDAFAIALRELAEMALIVGALCVYLRQAGRAALLLAVAWGGVLGAVPALAASVYLIDSALSPGAEAWLETGMALGVLTMATGMVASAGTIRGRVSQLLDDWLNRAPGVAMLAVVGFVALVVFRELLEVGVFVQAIASRAGHEEALLGLALGTAAAALVVPLWKWVRWRSGLLLAFRASALLLSLFAVRLLLHGVSDLARRYLPPAGEDEWPSVAMRFLEGGPQQGWTSALLMGLVLLHAARSWWFQARSSSA